MLIAAQFFKTLHKNGNFANSGTATHVKKSVHFVAPYCTPEPWPTTSIFFVQLFLVYFLFADTALTRVFDALTCIFDVNNILACEKCLKFYNLIATK